MADVLLEDDLEALRAAGVAGAAELVPVVEAIVERHVIAAVAEKRERFAAAIEAAFADWDAIGPNRAPHPLHSGEWLVERSYATCAQLVRETDNPVDAVDGDGNGPTDRLETLLTHAFEGGVLDPWLDGLDPYAGACALAAVLQKAGIGETGALRQQRDEFRDTAFRLKRGLIEHKTRADRAEATLAAHGLTGPAPDVSGVVEALLETDALTANKEPSDGLYTVHEDDLEYLVETLTGILRGRAGAPAQAASYVCCHGKTRAEHWCDDHADHEAATGRIEAETQGDCEEGDGRG